MCNLLQVSLKTDEEGNHEDFVNHNKKKVKGGKTQDGSKERVFLLKCMAIWSSNSVLFGNVSVFVIIHM
jgi:hypothetical protein